MLETKEQQQFFMRWAIALGEKGRMTAPPNPWVGCVIVQNNEIVGEGYHHAPGEAHAEVEALKGAGNLAKGSTVYISLEPCAHYGRTPPCVNRLIEAGVSRVVIPMRDPDTKVSGKGVEALKQAGIEVVEGICQKEAEHSLEPYLFHRRTQLPFTILKAASSIDGRVAAKDGSSKWITQSETRKDVHALRAQSQAIIVGSGTAIIDRPQLTVRDISVPHFKPPLRVLLDSSGRTPPIGPLFDVRQAPTLIFTTTFAPTSRIEEWKACGVEVEIVEKINLKEVLKFLGKREIIQVIIEGGHTLHAAFLQERLFHQLVLYLGACTIGMEGYSLFPLLSGNTMDEALRWKLENVCRFVDDVRLDYRPSFEVFK